MNDKFSSGMSVKMRNLLAIGCMMKNELDKALRVFEEAVKELKLDSEAGAALLAKGDQPDISCLLVNYIKCNTLKNGQGMGMDFFKNDPLNRTLFSYLVKMKAPIASEFL